MSLPETCPFCGSGVDLRNGEKWVGYTCITTIHAGHDARRMQSMTCAGLERTRLLARVAELEDDSKRLDWLLRRGVAWRGCYNKWWSEGEWLYEKGKPRDIIDEAMEAKP